MAARLNNDQSEANLIKQQFNIFGHGQPDQIVNYVRANLPTIHLAMNYYMIYTIVQRRKGTGTYGVDPTTDILVCIPIYCL